MNIISISISVSISVSVSISISIPITACVLTFPIYMMTIASICYCYLSYITARRVLTLPKCAFEYM
jgi:hypothetical protein